MNKGPLVFFSICMMPSVRAVESFRTGFTWKKALINLKRCLDSIEGQTCDDHMTVILKHEWDEIEEHGVIDLSKYKNTIMVNTEFKNGLGPDKVEKTSVGRKKYLEYNARFFCKLDYDDIFHRDSVKYIKENSDDSKTFWRIKDGYYYYPYKKTIKKLDGICSVCGSCNFFEFTEADNDVRPSRVDTQHSASTINGMEPKYIPHRYLLFTLHGFNSSHGRNMNWLEGFYNATEISLGPWENMSDEMMKAFNIL